MAEISKYDLATLIWLDATGCNRRHTMRKYDYSIRPICDYCLLVSPVISREGVHDVYLHQGTMNGDSLALCRKVPTSYPTTFQLT